MKRIICSRLRHRLTLQEEIQTADESGGYSRDWQDVATLWGEIISMTGTGTSSRGGREIPFAGQIQSEITHRILLRYREGITAGMRLLFETRAFNIRFVGDPTENKEILELVVEEGMAT